MIGKCSRCKRFTFKRFGWGLCEGCFLEARVTLTVGRRVIRTGMRGGKTALLMSEAPVGATIIGQGGAGGSGSVPHRHDQWLPGSESNTGLCMARLEDGSTCERSIDHDGDCASMGVPVAFVSGTEFTPPRDGPPSPQVIASWTPKCAVFDCQRRRGHDRHHSPYPDGGASANGYVE